MTPAQRDRDIESLRAAIRVLERAPVATPCQQCGFFRADDGYCERWNAPVPSEARAAGCGEWDEAIPF